MRFPYHQIDDDTIESAGNIQDSSSDRLSSGGASNDRHRNDDLEDLTTPSFRQLLPFWPFIIGIFQIVNGFLCAIFGRCSTVLCKILSVTFTTLLVYNQL